MDVNDFLKRGYKINNTITVDVLDVVQKVVEGAYGVTLATNAASEDAVVALMFLDLTLNNAVATRTGGRVKKDDRSVALDVQDVNMLKSKCQFFLKVACEASGVDYDHYKPKDDYLGVFFKTMYFYKH